MQHLTLVIERYLKLKNNITTLHFYTHIIHFVSIKVKGCDIMDTFEKILNIIKKNKGIVSTAEIVKLGIDKKYLSLMPAPGDGSLVHYANTYE